MAENTMKVEIISPDRIFYEGDATMVEMVVSEGEIGVYPGHIPMTNILKPGILMLHHGDKIERAALHEGFVEILQDKITILAETAEWPDEIDISRAREAGERAKRRIESKAADLDIARAELALRRSLVRIELVERYKK